MLLRARELSASFGGGSATSPVRVSGALFHHFGHSRFSGSRFRLIEAAMAKTAMIFAATTAPNAVRYRCNIIPPPNQLAFVS